MNPLYGIAASGMDYASRALDVSASNVANADTPDYKAKKAVAQARSDGGVTSTVVPTNATAPLINFADGPPLVGSNTDLVTERVTQMQALANYRANVASANAADEMERAVLDIKA